MGKPRVLVLADTPGWAWARKADAYKRHLSDEFDVTVAYYAAVPLFDEFDLLHLMEFPQLRLLNEYARTGIVGAHPFKVISGCTAHVWPTWGVEQMKVWALLCDAWHANSLLLQQELQ